MHALLRFPERHPGRTIAIVGLVFAAAYLTAAVTRGGASRRLIVGDAVHYYVYLRSMVFDGDLHFQNDYVRLYDLKGGEPGTGWIYERTATAHTRNLMPVGAALVWAPLFITTTMALGAARWMGAAVAFDGYGHAFQASAALSGIAAGCLGAWFAYRLAAAFAGRRLGIWSTLIVWIGSSALYYTLVSPAYSHAASMFAAGLFFYVWGTTLGDARWSRFVKVGLAAGFAALVRWQDAVFLLAPAIELASTAVSDRTRGAAGRALARMAVAVAAAAVAFLPQNFVWLRLYGTPLTVPQGGEFMKWSDPALVRVLFSDWHGLFSWTPIAAIAIAGLLVAAAGRRATSERTVSIAALAVFIVSWYVNAAVADWWAGEAFGARRFVSCFPIFVLGIAALAHRAARRERLAAVAAGALCVSNLLLLFQYQLFMHGRGDVSPYPGGLYGMTVERFVVPFRVLLRWWQT